MLKLKNQPNHNAVLIYSDSQDELGKTFIRFQEHYESCNPDFKGKVFTLGQFKSWYSKKYGADTYHHDWKGFNFPSPVLEPFRQGLFDPLTSYEIELLELLKYRNDEFYIIGANEDSVLRHELAHALYFHDTKYRYMINKTFDNYKKDIAQIKKYILNKGYHEDVLYDELQAYITDNDDEFILNNTPKYILKTITGLYDKHSKGKDL
jgi:hypothetical protein